MNAATYGNSKYWISNTDVLERKPGAVTGSKPLEQWRQQGRWPASYDALWQRLIYRYGQQNGTREMIELLQLGKRHGYDRLQRAIASALELGCSDVGALARYERPMPQLTHYDELLQTGTTL